MIVDAPDTVATCIISNDAASVKAPLRGRTCGVNAAAKYCDALSVSGLLEVNEGTRQQWTRCTVRLAVDLQSSTDSWYIDLPFQRIANCAPSCAVTCKLVPFPTLLTPELEDEGPESVEKPESV